MELKFWMEKNRKKKELEPARWRWGSWVGTMADVGGRVREGKPPKLWSNFGHDPKTPATGAVDFKRFAHSAEPNRLVVGMLGSWVAVWFSSFLVAVLLLHWLAF